MIDFILPGLLVGRHIETLPKLSPFARVLVDLDAAPDQRCALLRGRPRDRSVTHGLHLLLSLAEPRGSALAAAPSTPNP